MKITLKGINAHWFGKSNSNLKNSEAIAFFRELIDRLNRISCRILQVLHSSAFDAFWPRVRISFGPPLLRGLGEASSKLTIGFQALQQNKEMWGIERLPKTAHCTYGTQNYKKAVLLQNSYASDMPIEWFIRTCK